MMGVVLVLLGRQEPRLSSVPDGDSLLGDEAVEFARWAGMTLYPWQEDLLRDMCRTPSRADVSSDELGRFQVVSREPWSAREVVVPVARQNGKGEVLVARELAGVFLFGEKEIFHSAHFMDTAIDAQKRLWEVIEANDDLLYWWDDDPVNPGLPRKQTGNGKEAIKFPNGAQIYFRTRTKKTGRGLSIDLLIFDECYELPRETFAAMSKLTRAKEQAQTVYISSPVNREEHFHGDIFSAKRWSGIDGAPGVLFKEWSPDDDSDPFNQSTWEQANPSLVDSGPGAQIEDVRADALSAQNSSVLLDAFLVETLGIGKWVPRDSDLGDDFVPIFPYDDWRSHELTSSPKWSDLCLSVDATPDGEHASIVAALQCGSQVYLSLNPLTVFDRDEIVEAVGRNVEGLDPLGVVLDPSGPCSTLVEPLQKRGVEPEQLNGSKVSQAYELMVTLFREGRLVHDGDPRWLEELEIAEERSRNGRYRSLERFVGNVTGLVAASLAVWGLQQFAIPKDTPESAKKKKYVGRAATVPRPKPRVMAF